MKLSFIPASISRITCPACFLPSSAWRSPRYNLGVYGGTHGVDRTHAHRDGAGAAGRAARRCARVRRYHFNIRRGAGRGEASHPRGACRSRSALLQPGDAGRSNRVLTDRISTWLFTPTEVAAAHLLREGFPSGAILRVGVVMLDVALQHGGRVSARDGLLDRLGFEPRGFFHATIL